MRLRAFACAGLIALASASATAAAERQNQAAVTSYVVVKCLDEAIVTHIRKGGLHEQLATIGVISETGSPQQFATFIRSETEKWGAVMKFSSMKQESY